MKCLDCTFDNPDGARFCQNCGRPLARACPGCGRSTPPAARFCPNCGHKLIQDGATGQAGPPPFPAPEARAAGSEQSAPGGADALGELRRAAPAGLADKILAERALLERGPAEGERKIVTVLFVDIVGSTELAESMDPEEWGEIVAGAHRLIGDAVYRYEGTIAQLLGDGLLAFFGAPIAHEDDGERAVRTALAVLAAAEGYEARLRGQGLPGFQVRIGLNTGLVVVRNIGTDLHMEYLAVGDTVNLAARMQAAAEPGAILITESTYRPVAGLFVVEDQGLIRVKGKAEPVHVYRVAGERRGAVRARGIAGLASPVVGRDHELALLSEMLSDLGSGRGAVVTLLGEAGLGKSRLVSECRKTAESRRGEGRALRWVEARCLSYGTAMPHHLTAGILAGLAELPVGASDEALHAKLARAAGEAAGAEREEILPFLAQLIGLPLAGEAAERVRYLAGPALQAQQAAACRRLLAGLAGRATVVVSCDDLHWIDPSSAEVLAQMLPAAAEAGVAFLLTARPDGNPAAASLLARAHATPGAGQMELRLGPLSEVDCRKLIGNLLEAEALPDGLHRLILAKAEGNPFFVEEVLRMLIDTGIIARPGARWIATRKVQDIDIPDTLQGVLAARIDGLPGDAKRTLQLAAVIGRRFHGIVIERVLGGGPGQDERLGQLEHSGLIRAGPGAAEREYTFHHLLVQETIYASLLRADRKRLHLAVAEAMEGLYADRRVEMAPVLAHHFDEAGESARALPYYVQAGDAAAGIYASTEAITHYQRALELAQGAFQTFKVSETSKVSNQGGLLLHLYDKLGRALELAGRQREALDNYEQMQEVGRANGDRPLELAGMVARMTLNVIPSEVLDIEGGRAIAEQALNLARELNDRAAEARVQWNLLMLHMFSGDPVRGAVHGEEALAIARDLGSKELLAHTLTDLGRAYMSAGRVQEALAAQREAQGTWEELHNWPMLADSLNYQAFFLAVGGSFEEALAMSERAYRMAAAIGNLWGQSYSLMTPSVVYLERGEFSRALKAMDECVVLAERAGFAFPGVSVRVFEAIIYLILGAADRAEWLLAVAMSMAAPMAGPVKRLPMVVQAELLIAAGDLEGAEGLLAGIPVEVVQFEAPGSVQALLARGRLALARGRPAECQRLAEELAGKLRAFSGPAIYLADALQLCGEALLEQGRLAEARDALEAARRAAEERGARRTLWTTLLLLAEAEERCGNAQAAAARRKEAREVVRYIAEHIEDAELRAGFLGQPRVRELIEERT